MISAPLVFGSMKSDPTSVVASSSSSDSSSQKLEKKYQNLLVKQTCLRLYSSRDTTGDIKFKIGHEEISAHKCILAALSPMYEAQFYGAGEFDDKTSKVIEIKDVTAAAFTEFLQFFYLNSVQLTHENIEHVLTLAKRSLVDEFVTECINFLTETVSNENVCLTYYLAVQHECKHLLEMCEKKISLHPNEVFASKGFITSCREVIFNILQLDSINCKEIEIFNACIAWAKNVCTENGSDIEDMNNLRDVLIGTETTVLDLLHQIRFGVMSIEEFMVCYKSYKALFTEDERDEILYTIGKVNTPNAKRFKEELRDVPYKKWNEDAKIECSLISVETSMPNFIFGKIKTTFSINQPILLGGFYCCSLFEDTISGTVEKTVSANLTIVRKTPFNGNGMKLFSSVEQLVFETVKQTFVQFQRPIFIKPHLIYEIQLEFKEGFTVKAYEFKKMKNYDLNKNTTVTFHDIEGLVTRLILNFCNEDDDEHRPYMKAKPMPIFNINNKIII